MPTVPTPTTRMIAAECGVHFTTVSLALRNDPRVLPTTRERILAAAKRMGYRPNPAFTALMAQVRSGQHPENRETLAYVTHWRDEGDWRRNHAHSGHLAGATARATELGYGLEIFDLARQPLSGARLSGILRARGIRGAILAAFYGVTEPLALDWESLSAVQIDVHASLVSLPSVTNDQSQMAMIAYRRLREAGYRRIGIAIKAGWDANVRHSWLSGYLGAERLAGVEDGLRPFISEDWNQSAFAAWLAREKPDAIMTLDRAFVWTWLAKLGLRAPEDIGYVELDLLPGASTEFAGIRQNHEAVGAGAVDLLVSHLYHNRVAAKEQHSRTLIEGHWRDGASAPGVLTKKTRLVASRRVALKATAA